MLKNCFNKVSSLQQKGDLWDQMPADVEVIEEPMDPPQGTFVTKELVAFSSSNSEISWPFHSESAKVVMDSLCEICRDYQMKAEDYLV